MGGWVGLQSARGQSSLHMCANVAPDLICRGWYGMEGQLEGNPTKQGRSWDQLLEMGGGQADCVWLCVVGWKWLWRVSMAGAGGG